MADLTERSPLIKNNKGTQCSKWMRRMRNRYSNVFVTSRGAALCLFWFGIGINLYLVIPASWVILNIPSAHSLKVSLIIISCAYLLWPIMGYMGERWTRYYVIMTGVVVSCLATLALQVMMLWYSFDSTTFTENSTLIAWIVTFCYTIYDIGFGLVYANIIQFSTDKIQEASSEELASFTRWWAFTISFSYHFSFYLFVFLRKICNDNNCFAQMVFILQFVFSVPYLLIGVCFKCYFVIESPSTVDPLKLVYHVLEYAWKHRYPERRSAFTYSDDPPSRLDYGKDRYGGPFTTDQVESVKSFWYILPVIISVAVSLGFSVDIQIPNNMNNATTSAESAELAAKYFISISDLPFTLIPLIFQLILYPLCPCLIPSMLKRMWFGLLLNTSSYIGVTIAVYPFIDTANADESSYTLLVFYIIGRIGSAIVGFTSLEFIFAQAPIHFQGLLIGIWCINFGNLNSFFAIRTFTYSCFVTGLLCVLLLVYSVAMYRYKYRLRNELSDINRRQIVEDIYERNINQRSAIKNNDDFDSYELFIRSID